MSAGEAAATWSGPLCSAGASSAAGTSLVPGGYAAAAAVSAESGMATSPRAAAEATTGALLLRLRRDPVLWWTSQLISERSNRCHCAGQMCHE